MLVATQLASKRNLTQDKPMQDSSRHFCSVRLSAAGLSVLFDHIQQKS